MRSAKIAFSSLLYISSSHDVAVKYFSVVSAFPVNGCLPSPG